MSDFDPKAHWNKIYSTKSASEMSWTQTSARISLELIKLANLEKNASIVDVGGGMSVLIEELLNERYQNLSVVELSIAAIESAKKRLGDRASSIRWIEGDITHTQLPNQSVELWHDRAVFHFLTEKKQRESYLTHLNHALKPNGFIVIATFGEKGPEKCSGLTVHRYSPDQLKAELGGDFHLIKSLPETHTTPWGATQEFTYCLFQKRARLK